MKVGLAAKLLSNSVAAGLLNMLDHLGDYKPDNTEDTAFLLKCFNDWYD